MIYSWGRARGLAVLAAVLAAGGARADYLNWSYGWALSGGPTFKSGFTAITFAVGSGGSTGTATIPVGSFSSANLPEGSPGFFAPRYSLALTLTDNATHDSGTLTYHGFFSGTPGGAGMSNFFSDPDQSLTLDGHVYHVTLDSSTPIGGPQDPPASVWAQVSVSGTSAGGVQRLIGASQQAPEPSGLLLAGLGAVLFLGARRRGKLDVDYRGAGLCCSGNFLRGDRRRVLGSSLD